MKRQERILASKEKKRQLSVLKESGFSTTCDKQEADTWKKEGHFVAYNPMVKSYVGRQKREKR